MARQTVLRRETAEIVKTPEMYIVVMHNDDYTTIDFVVEVLMKIFHKSSAEASAIMMEVHTRGEGIAGMYTYDLAVTKKAQAERLAGERNFPLRLSVYAAG
ncbi:MAG: ATP-dependent Clp protease adaptor ClpS [Clostridiales bacterium]|jgi:ATP-dependent Clp protease adaptor protein ClpS|nr:ATP-dependent Clp protease adaptor ClpS [Clostridiales bacterium]